MRLFVYECISAGGLGSAPASLRSEGWAMLAALVEDFSGIGGVEVTTLLDDAAPRDLGHVCRRIDAANQGAAFRQTAHEADRTLVIAPEFDNLLATFSQWAMPNLLGTGPATILQVADKVRLEQTLRAANVRTPPIVTILPTQTPDGAGGEANAFSAAALPSRTTFPAICKPRTSAGCRGLRRLDQAKDISETIAAIRLEAPEADLLVQPFLPGAPVSVAFLCGPGQTLALRAGRQDLRWQGNRLTYHGGSLPLPAEQADRATKAASRALACFPGLRGYVGVDLLLGEAADGSGDQVIEINPRPTTSYIGLRRLSTQNLAEAWLRLSRGEWLAPLRWREGRLDFAADGKIMAEPAVSKRGQDL